MLPLDGKVILITGGSGRLAKFLAEELHQLGANLILIGRNEERLKKLSKDLNKKSKSVTYFICDLTQEAEVIDLIGKINKSFSSIDIVINSVGSWYAGSLMEHSSEAINSLFNSNIIGLAIFTKHIIPLLQKSSFGQILNVISLSILKPIDNWPIYSATKAAVQSFTKSLRYELQNKKLRVMEIYPDGMSWVESEQTISYEKMAKIITYMLSQSKDIVLEQVTVKKL